MMGNCYLPSCIDGNRCCCLLTEGCVVQVYLLELLISLSESCQLYTVSCCLCSKMPEWGGLLHISFCESLYWLKLVSILKP